MAFPDPVVSNGRSQLSDEVAVQLQPVGAEMLAVPLPAALATVVLDGLTE